VDCVNEDERQEGMTKTRRRGEQQQVGGDVYNYQKKEKEFKQL
jgi:hypothetical protein